MKTYEFEYFDGYIIPVIDGVKVLVDTGCPITVSSGSTLPSLGDIWMTPATNEFNPQVMSGFDVENLEIEVLLGRNYLAVNPFLVDWDQQTISFEADTMPDGDEIPLTIVMAGATVTGRVNDSDVALIVDTGAKISFLGHHKFSESPVIGRVEDYHLSTGHFTADVIPAHFSSGEIEMNLYAGRLDNALFEQLRTVEIDGILGNDIYDHYHQVWYDFPRNRLVFSGRRERALSTERVTHSVKLQ